VRTALYEAAHVILTRPVKGSALKSWAARIAKRAGMSPDFPYGRQSAGAKQ
jgi:transposase